MRLERLVKGERCAVDGEVEKKLRDCSLAAPPPPPTPPPPPPGASARGCNRADCWPTKGESPKSKFAGSSGDVTLAAMAAAAGPLSACELMWAFKEPWCSQKTKHWRG